MTSGGSIFLSYARPDRDRVRPYSSFLKQCGFDVWFDEQQLLPGERWDFEIRSALARADFVILFVSRDSVDRRGYLQRELKIAVDQSANRLIDDIYLIPVLLDDDVTVPQQIAELQYIAASRPDCKEQLQAAINRQRTKLGIQRQAIKQREDLSWETREISESWEGLPGYRTTLQFIDARSSKYAGLDVVGAYIKGELLKTLLTFRRQRFEQLPEAFNYGQDKFLRTNTHDAFCGTPSLVGSVLSIPYQVMWYGAGAAHPNYEFKVFNFILDPVSLMPPLQDMFTDRDTALATLQKSVREQLYDLVDEQGEPKLTRKWVNEGTENWTELGPYEFTQAGIRFLFAPYHVGAYALGDHSVEVPFRDFVKLLRPDFTSLLAINHVLWQASQ